jgi:Predicted solute binding protein
MKGKTYATTTSETATTATSTTTATTGSSLATLITASTLTTTHSTLRLGLRRLGLASDLDRDLALKDLLARQLLDGLLGLVGSGKVDKRIANRAVGAWVHWNGGAFTENIG